MAGRAAGAGMSAGEREARVAVVVEAHLAPGGDLVAIGAAGLPHPLLELPPVRIRVAGIAARHVSRRMELRQADLVLPLPLLAPGAHQDRSRLELRFCAMAEDTRDRLMGALQRAFVELGTQVAGAPSEAAQALLGAAGGVLERVGTAAAAELDTTHRASLRRRAAIADRVRAAASLLAGVALDLDRVLDAISRATAEGLACDWAAVAVLTSREIRTTGRPANSPRTSSQRRETMSDKRKPRAGIDRRSFIGSSVAAAGLYASGVLRRAWAQDIRLAKATHPRRKDQDID